MRSSDLDRLAEVCRKHGISEYQVTKDGDVSIKFHSYVASKVETKDEEKKVERQRPNGVDLALRGIS